MATISNIEAIIVSVPAEGNAFAEGAEETVLVKVTDDDGVYGVGECVATPDTTRAMIDQPTINFWSQGIKDLLIGADPLEAKALYDKVYHKSFYHGRRGMLIHALSAVDIALYDLAGKQVGKPVYKLLGGARCEKIRPYATIYPGDIYAEPIAKIVAELEKLSGDGIRSVTVRHVNKDVAPSSIEVSEDGQLAIVWANDGHQSSYFGSWLRAYCYSDTERARRQCFEPKIWKADLLDNFPTVDYASVCNRESDLLSMFELLRDYGIVKLRNVGDDPEETERLANLVGPIHQTTVYGYIYDVQAEPVSKLGGKTAMHQDPHHDDSFYYSPPGIDVFHCLLNPTGSGGESTYVDGFAIAEALREEAPEAFELLTTVPVSFHRRHPGEIDVRCCAPLIRLDWNGSLSGIRYFDRALAPLDAPVHVMEALFEAVREYNARMVSPEFKLEFLVPSGAGMLIDNQRVMHGRNAFSAHSKRRIRLCHVDRDEFHGRLRDLGARMGRADYDLILPAGAFPA